MFLNAGDPPLEVLVDVLVALDALGVDCVELAVPFPDSVTDGPVIRRSAARALAGGVGLPETLAFVARTRQLLRRTRIALLADWRFSLKDGAPDELARRVADSGVDGLLVHGLPPRLRPAWQAAVEAVGLPVVGTCYQGVSTPQTMAMAARQATAYLYLVAHYGRSGTRASNGFASLAATITSLRGLTNAPIAVGFGVTSRADVAAVAAAGADAAIVGSATVATVERSLANRSDVAAEISEFVCSLQQPAPATNS